MSATHWEQYARGLTDDQIDRHLVEIGFVILMGGDLGGPLPPGIRRSYAEEQRALRAELKRRGKKIGATL